jgi:hypothetical protein
VTDENHRGFFFLLLFLPRLFLLLLSVIGGFGNAHHLLALSACGPIGVLERTSSVPFNLQAFCSTSLLATLICSAYI